MDMAMILDAALFLLGVFTLCIAGLFRANGR